MAENVIGAIAVKVARSLFLWPYREIFRHDAPVLPGVYSASELHCRLAKYTADDSLSSSCVRASDKHLILLAL